MPTPTTLTRTVPVLCVLAVLAARPARAESPSPQGAAATATIFSTPSPAASATLHPSGTPFGTAPSASPTPALGPTAANGAELAPDSETATNDMTVPVATLGVARPRVFRTPERSAPPAFVAPDGGSGDADQTGSEPEAAPPAAAGNPGPAAGGGSGLVALRTTARTALEGFDLRVGYPPSLGSFGTSAQQPDCNAGTGFFVAASDRGTGELHLVVASAQSLPFPLDVFCRFALASGARLTASDFTVRVAEVTSDGKKADPALLLVSVAVR